MEQVYQGYEYFRRILYPRKKKIYRKLERGQNPKTMFMRCSDSRKCLREVLGVKPGEAFCGCNPGNIIPPFGTTLGGDEAAIEYGVQVLKVDHLVVLGHTGCGAMQALHNGIDKIKDKMPAVHRMLSICGTNPDLVRGKRNELLALTHLHIKTQLQNLMTYPYIRESCESGRLQLHGWIFRIGSGRIDRYDKDRDKFVPLPEGTIVK